MTKKLGQYFTTNKVLQDKVFEFIQNDPKEVLEPCIGRGDLVAAILRKNKEISFDCYEIDKGLTLLEELKNTKVIYEDFLKINISKKYKTIIGNPPYINTKTGNLYLDFTEKCFELLENSGELIFVVPSDFFKLTSAANMLSKMYKFGSFTDIFHPHNEKMFEGASIDVLIFRYYKDALLPKITNYNGVKMHTFCSKGMISFSTNNYNENTGIFEDFFDIYVGLVSGKESVFKNQELGNVEVITGFGVKEKYILIDEFSEANLQLKDYLLRSKPELLSRKIRKFDYSNWFEWGALRNIKVMKEKQDHTCIYISNLSRKETVAFTGKVNYFGGNLLMLIPKNPDLNLKKAVEYLNSTAFRENFTFSGRFKIGQRQLSNSYISSKDL